MLFFLALELLLTLFGVRPDLYEKDPYVGFSSSIPLFVERTSPEGTVEMVTAENKLTFFNAQSFPKEKKAGTIRIFCLGGSTTYGRPYDDQTSFCGWMRELLPVVDPSTNWEVINAGGISYASYRVALLMEELVRYQPDLFVIYSGHNEFLEQRTYEKLIDMPTTVRSVGALASRSRTWTAMKSVIDRMRSKQANETEQVTWLPAEVAAVLDRSVGPDVYTRDDESRAQILTHYRYSLSRMLDIAQSAGAAVILVTPASNLRDCSPFKSENRADLQPAEYERFVQAVFAAQKAWDLDRFDDCLAALSEAEQIDERHAALQYMRGRVLDRLERFPEARAAYEIALEEDVCPLRAPLAVRQTVMDIASEYGTPVVDFAARVDELASQHIPGNDLFLDHVHPTIELHRTLALAILKSMAQNEYIHPRSDLQRPWEEDPDVQRATERLESRIDPDQHATALVRLAMVMSWAGKFKDGYQAAERAVELAPESAEAHYHLARCAAKLGKLTEATEHFDRVVQLSEKDDPVPYFLPEAHNNLGYICERQGELEAAGAHYNRAVQLRPDFAEAHYNLGVLHKRLGNLAEADRSFRTALRIQPEFAQACLNLGTVLEAQGQLEAAAGQYQRALALQPGYEKAAAHLEAVLQKQQEQ